MTVDSGESEDTLVNVVNVTFSDGLSTFPIPTDVVDSIKLLDVVGSIWSSSSKKMIVEPVTTFLTGSEWYAVVSKAFM